MVKQRVKPNTDVDSITPDERGADRLPNGRFTKEHMIGLATRFGQPGVAGHTPSPQKHYLYHYIAKYSEMSAKQLRQLREEGGDDLSCSQIMAIKTVEQGMTSDRLDEIKMLVEREMGKARQDIAQETETTININITSYKGDE